MLEGRFEVMGTTAQVTIDSDQTELLDHVRQVLVDVARRWTRFDPASELSQLNRADGAPVVVSADTARLLAAAVDAWRRTDGRFDPSVHDALVACGYDRTFAAGPGPSHDALPSPGVADVHIDPTTGVITLPPGVRLDLGGIGKGFAADLVVDDLLGRGVRGAAVAIGGDARVGGACPLPGGWPIVSPAADGPIAHLEHGGFCYSTTRLRRWTVDGEERHHIVDPTTGRPSTSAVRDVAVAAATATIAEVHATAALVVPLAEALAHLEATGLDGYVIDETATMHTFGAWSPNPRISAVCADGTHRE